LRFVSLAHYLIARPEPRPKRHFVVELRRRSVKAERRLSFILGIGYATLGEKVFQDELPLVAFPLEGGQNLEAAALLGRIVNVGRLGGMTGEFNFDLHALKRIDYIGVTFRTRSLDEIREINRLMRADLWPTVEAGKLSLPIYETYPLDDIAEALALMRSNQHFGKIVISIG
jgi:NADPH:quinone reductase-like Zn-dependent oxidoreductase